MCIIMEIEKLQSTLKTLENELKEIKESQKQIKKSFKKNKSTKSNVRKQEASDDNGVSTLPKMVQSPITDEDDANILLPEIIRMSQKIEELCIKFNLISKTVFKLEAATVKLESEIDNLEQYGRRNCLILHGLENVPNAQYNYNGFVEFLIKIINRKLNEALTTNCVDIAHPLPKSNSGKTPIIIKFVKRSDRNAIFKRKRLFVKSGLAITESLTRKIIALLNEARALLGQENVWTWNEIIYCDTGSSKEQIKYQEELYLLISRPFQN